MISPSGLLMAMILILLFENSSYKLTWFIYMFIHKEKEKKNKKSQIQATFKCLLGGTFKSEAMVSSPKDT